MTTTLLSYATALLLSSGVLVAVVGCGQTAASTNENAGETVIAVETKETVSATPGKAQRARQQAAEEGKYLFALFTKTDDDKTTAMRTTFDAAVAQVTDRANSITVDVTDPGEQDVVREFGLERAPMPLALAIAPNGAITGGFPTQFTEQDLLSAFATPATEKVMKSLQDGKLVFLCVQNDQTELSEEAIKGVNGFAADKRFRDITTIVPLDPSDEDEAPFMNDLQIDRDTKTAITVVLAPPGSPIAMIEGATTKEHLVAQIEKAGARGPSG